MKENFCSLCEKVRIIGFDENNKPFELPIYREHFIELSNGSLLKVGVDETCKISLVSGKKVRENAEKILEGYKEHLREIAGYRSDFESWNVTHPNTSKEDFHMARVRKDLEEKKNLDAQKLLVEEMSELAESSEEKRQQARIEYEKELKEEKEKNTKKSQSIIFGI